MPSQLWKPDPEVIIKSDGLCTRTLASEYKQPIFDTEQDEPDLTKSREITLRSDPTTDGPRNTPGMIPEDYSFFFLNDDWTNTDQVTTMFPR